MGAKENDGGSGFDLAAAVAQDSAQAAAKLRLGQSADQALRQTMAQAGLPPGPVYHLPPGLQQAYDAAHQDRFSTGEVRMQNPPQAVARTITCETLLRKEGVRTPAELTEMRAVCPPGTGFGTGMHVPNPGVLQDGPNPFSKAFGAQAGDDAAYRQQQIEAAQRSLAAAHNADLVRQTGYNGTEWQSQYAPAALGGLAGWAAGYLPRLSDIRKERDKDLRTRAATTQTTLTDRQATERSLLNTLTLDDSDASRQQVFATLPELEKARIRAVLDAIQPDNYVAREAAYRNLMQPHLDAGREAAVAYNRRPQNHGGAFETAQGLGRGEGDAATVKSVLEQRQRAFTALKLDGNMTEVTKAYNSLDATQKTFLTESEVQDLNERFRDARAASGPWYFEAGKKAVNATVAVTAIDMAMGLADRAFGASPHKGPAESWNWAIGAPITAGLLARNGITGRKATYLTLSGFAASAGLAYLYDWRFPEDPKYSTTRSHLLEPTGTGNFLIGLATALPVKDYSLKGVRAEAGWAKVGTEIGLLRKVPDGVSVKGGLITVGVVAGTVALTQGVHALSVLWGYDPKKGGDAAYAQTDNDAKDRTGSSFEAAVNSWTSLGQSRPEWLYDKMVDYTKTPEQQRARENVLIAARQNAIIHLANGKTILEKGTPLGMLTDDPNFQDPDQGGFLSKHRWHFWGANDDTAHEQDAKFMLPGSHLDIGGPAMTNLLMSGLDLGIAAKAATELDGKTIDGKKVDAKAEIQELQGAQDQIKTELDKIYAPHPDVESAVKKLKGLMESDADSQGQKDLNQLGIMLALAIGSRKLQYPPGSDTAIILDNRSVAKLCRDMAMIRLAQAENDLSAPGGVATHGVVSKPVEAAHALIAQTDSVWSYLKEAKQLDPDNLGDAKEIARLADQAYAKWRTENQQYIADNPGDYFLKLDADMFRKF